LDNCAASRALSDASRRTTDRENTASLKPPMCGMSSRSGACDEPSGWMSMQTSFGAATPFRRWLSTMGFHSLGTPGTVGR